MPTRREFLMTGAAVALPAIAQPAAADYPLVDYHAHISREVSLEAAIASSKRRGYKYGVLQHAGTKANRYAGLLSSDDDLKSWLAETAGKPVYRGIQAEWIDWMPCFSKEMLAKIDYILSDALTMPDKSGKPMMIWTPSAQIGDPQEFMNRYVDHHVLVMTKEPIDIIANVTFLPDALVKDYDKLWTEKRMRTVIEASVKYKVALEINSRYKVPSDNFLKMAKAAGATFSFGSNLHSLEAVGDIDWSIQTARRLQLKPSSLFRPAPAGRKPVERRKMT